MQNGSVQGKRGKGTKTVKTKSIGICIKKCDKNLKKFFNST